MFGGDCNSQLAPSRTTRSLYVDIHDEGVVFFQTFAGCQFDVLAFRMRMSG